MPWIVMLFLSFVRGRLGAALVPQGRKIFSRRFAKDQSLDVASAIESEVASGERGGRRSLSAQTRNKVAFRQEYRCAGCDILLPPDYQIDHIVPVALNGSNVLTNLQALCVKCHSQKTRDQRHQIISTKRREEVPQQFATISTKQGIVLNEAQEEAVKMPANRSVRVVAGPGTGKTRVLIRRIEELLKTEHPSSILALTFTNKAAREMRERLGRSDVRIGTFHGICLSWLRAADDAALPGHRRVGFAIYDEKTATKLVKGCIETLGLSEDVTPAEAQHAISWSKNMRLELKDPRLAKVKHSYETELIRRNAVDFDDMLLLTLEILHRRRDDGNPRGNDPRGDWKHVLVDEFQDTNGIQYDILRALDVPVFAVGDGDQAIYSWRGADYTNLAKFDRDFPGRKLVKLSENYRSTQEIVDLYSSLMKASTAVRDDNELVSRLTGEKPMVIRLADSREEARFVSDAISRMSGPSVAVLYRTNHQSLEFEKQFAKDGVRYKVGNGRKFLGRREILDVTAYLRLASGSDDEASCERVMNVPRRKIGDVTLRKLKTHADLGLLEAARRRRDNLTTTAANAVAGFVDLVDDLREKAQNSTVGELIIYVVNAIKYKEYLSSSLDEPEGRIENVYEFANFASGFSDLVSFLDECTMVQDQDSLSHSHVTPDKTPPVHLLTVHAAKGLEYDVVFVAGVESFLFPHYYAYARDGETEDQNEGKWEEERRLLYVALSRAKKHVYLTLTQRRQRHGVYYDAHPSPFLRQIPEDKYRDTEIKSHDLKDITAAWRN